MVIEGGKGPITSTTNASVVEGGRREKQRFSPTYQVVRGGTEVHVLKSISNLLSTYYVAHSVQGKKDPEVIRA